MLSYTQPTEVLSHTVATALSAGLIHCYTQPKNCYHTLLPQVNAQPPPPTLDLGALLGLWAGEWPPGALGAVKGADQADIISIGAWVTKCAGGILTPQAQ